MQLYNNFSLRDYHTFKFNVKSETFAQSDDLDDIVGLLKGNRNGKILILGGGSNILFTKDFDGLVIKYSNNKIAIANQDDTYVYLKISAGTDWNDLVNYAVDNNFGGIENLYLIPGVAGAAPIQNIGAYGVELKDVFVSLNGINLNNFEEVELTKEDCKFGYRNSIFKNELKGKFFITEIILRLTKRNHKLNIEYGAIRSYLDSKNISEPTIKDIKDTVGAIRRAKLPDPKKLGNAGSFFKNPEITREQFTILKNKFNDIPSFSTLSKLIKIPAGWLIEKCGWKGYRNGDAGCYEKQALIIVNYGDASPKEIINLSKNIKASVKEKFNITLEEEVNFL
ncbi:MAG TPA: UDP-N-acetylmuramate dehydrogenase [Ignavibacteriaceae bacterium]|nr:UDP-N-acetylmuramate dehydrogenase [Ignavibacteriaceae bacterium]